MELLKILKEKKIVICFLLLLFATTGFYLYEQNKEIQKQEQSYLINGIEKKSLSYEEQQAQYALSYHDDVLYIIQQADLIGGVSIFKQADSFSSRNIKKTMLAYERVLEVKPSIGNFKALEQVLSCDVIGYSVFLFSFLLILYFLRDEKNGLRNIFYATVSGRARLAMRQLSVMAFMVAVYTIICFGCTYMASCFLYGYHGDWFASAQSMMLLKDFTYPLSVFSYTLLYLAWRIVFAIAAVFLAWLCLSLFRNRIIGFCVLVLCFGGETVLRFAIRSTSVFNYLRHINIYNFIHPGSYLYSYLNMNLLGCPFNCFIVQLSVAIITALLACAGIMFIAEKRRPVYSSGKIERVFLNIQMLVDKTLHKLISHFSVRGYELYKLLFVNKGILFVILWILLTGYQLDFSKIMFVGKGAMLKEIYLEYAGEEDGKLRDYISEQKLLLAYEKEIYEAKMSAYEKGEISTEEYYSASGVWNSYTTLMEVLENLEEQLAYVDKLKEKGIRAQVVYETPYRILWAQNGFYQGEGYANQEIREIVNLICMILLLSSLFAYDKKSAMQNVIRCCRNGRCKLFRLRAVLVFAFCLLISVSSYLLRVAEIAVNYPFMTWNAPVQSLSFMEDFPLRISIVGFLALVLIIRVLALWAVTWISQLLVYRFSSIRGVIISVGILVLPQVVYMIGFRYGWYFSIIQPLIYVELLKRYGFLLSGVIEMLVISLGVYCMLYVRRLWCDKKQN